MTAVFHSGKLAAKEPFMKLTSRICALGAPTLTGISLPAVHADSFRDREAKFASGAGFVLYAASGVVLPLLEDGKDGKQHALRTADALLTSTLITEGLKHVIHEDRPDHSDDDSFPSGHATIAFTVAAMQAHYHPKQAPLWYLGAGVIAESRVQRDKHHWHDVVAGGLIGYATAHYELKQKRGFLLIPFIGSREDGSRTGGVTVTKTF
jgi:hypothetical protein